MRRKAGVRGTFYPQSCQEIESMIKNWNQTVDSHIRDKTILTQKPRAIISPHAGYIYSGFTANLAHRILSNTKPKRVIIFGPSHHVFIEGVSVSEMGSYETPCGDMAIDLGYIDSLKKRFNLSFEPKAHGVEHSTETQMPLIKHYLPDVKVVEFIYGRIASSSLAKIIYEVLKDRDNLVVISTDLSHFHTLDEAKKRDLICLEAIEKMDIGMLERGCEACGMIGVKAILEVARAMRLQSRVLDYRTSAEASGDKSRVVGYLSAMIG